MLRVAEGVGGIVSVIFLRGNKVGVFAGAELAFLA